VPVPGPSGGGEHNHVIPVSRSRYFDKRRGPTWIESAEHNLIMSDDELPPSRLGTKDHWDEVYKREVNVFRVSEENGMGSTRAASSILQLKWSTTGNGR
jgi:hypothetical protein